MMLETGILLGGNLARVGINYKFVNIFAHKKGKRKSEIAAWLIYWCITSTVTLILGSLPVNVFTNIIFLIFLAKISVESISKSVFIGVLIYFINMACDGLVYILFTRYVAGQQVEIFYSVLTVILIFVAEQFAEKVICMKDEEELPNPIWAVLTAIPLSSVVIVYAIVTRILDDANRGVVGVIVCGILFNNLLIFSLYNSILKLYKSRLDQQILERQVESYMNQLRLYQKSQEKYHSLKHDIKKHLGVIFKLLENQENAAVTEYLKKMEADYRIQEEYVRTGNKEIDSIFNYMLRDAKTELKKLDIHIRIPEDFKMDLYDINTLLGNLLENAVYAAKISKDREISIDMYMEKMILYINIRNSYGNEIKYRKGRYITTRSGGHGIGLKNVEKIVEKYNGLMKIQHDDTYFEVSAMLYME